MVAMYWKEPMHIKKDEWSRYFLSIANEVSSRATCDRLKVGALIVRDRRILATGYNGSISGDDHCNDVGHLMVDDHCIRTVHAEANAIMQSAKFGVQIDSAEIYVTHTPCWKCFQLIANAGIKRIVCSNHYRVDDNVERVASKLGIEIVYIDLGD